MARLRRAVRERDLGELLSGASSALVIKAAGLGLGYAFAVAVTRSAGADAWGVFSLCFTVLTLASIAARMGTDTALLRLMAAGQGGRAEAAGLVRVATRLVLPSAVVCALAVHFGAEVLAGRIFHKPQLAAAIRTAAWGVPPVALSLLLSQGLRGLRRVAEYSFFDLVARFLSALALFPLALRLTTPELAPVLAFVIGAYLVAAANLLVMRSRVRGLPQGDPARAWSGGGRALLAIGFPLLLASSAVYLKGWVDTVMLGIMRTEAEVGVYNLALKLATLAGLPLVAVNSIAAPRFAAAYGRGDQAALRREVEHSGRLILVSSVPIAAVLIIFAGPLLSVFGREVAVGVPTLRVLTLGFLLSALVGSVGYLLQMTGRQWFFQAVTTVTLVFNVLSNLLLIPRFGIMGAGISTAAGLVVWNLTCWWYVFRRLRIQTVPGLSRLGLAGGPVLPQPVEAPAQ
jgi:O-antigen/teichoic acid export membrane protein